MSDHGNAQSDPPNDVANRRNAQPIASAQVVSGQIFGPVMVWPDLDGNWTRGLYNGGFWECQNGFRIDPQYLDDLASMP
jgi:hypothetical protein